MPIPDAIIPKEIETEDQSAARERYEAVNAACNALLRRQMTCGKCCHWCAEKCEELQAWLDVGEK